RYFFILKHSGQIRHEFLFYGAMLVFAVSVIASSKPKKDVAAMSPVPFSTAQAIVDRHCATCHAATPSHKGFAAAPLGAAFDTPQQIQKYASKIHERTVATTSMPLGNETGMTDDERAQLGAWIQQGAKIP
ncbi:MAG TPA: c-type cytochrome, partial [Caulobacter sp.]|nr:c-type cytochrome [Caulobacter sp.]